MRPPGSSSGTPSRPAPGPARTAARRAWPRRTPNAATCRTWPARVTGDSQIVAACCAARISATWPCWPARTASSRCWPGRPTAWPPPCPRRPPWPGGAMPSRRLAAALAPAHGASSAVCRLPARPGRGPGSSRRAPRAAARSAPRCRPPGAAVCPARACPASRRSVSWAGGGAQRGGTRGPADRRAQRGVPEEHVGQPAGNPRTGNDRLAPGRRLPGRRRFLRRPAPLSDGSSTGQSVPGVRLSTEGTASVHGHASGRARGGVSIELAASCC